jgi:hypothetical protein
MREFTMWGWSRQMTGFEGNELVMKTEFGQGGWI